MTKATDTASLRDTAKGGTDPLPKLTDHDGEMLVFDCTPSSIISGKGAGEDGKAHYKDFPDAGYGASTNLCVPMLKVSPNGNGEYTLYSNTAVFQQVLGQTMEHTLDGFALGELESPYVIGRLGKSGRTWVLNPPEDDSEWDAIEQAVAKYESDF